MRASWLCSLIVASCCAAASVFRAHAQETINYASVSGRVTDPQGAVVPARRSALVKRTPTSQRKP